MNNKTEQSVTDDLRLAARRERIAYWLLKQSTEIQP